MYGGLRTGARTSICVCEYVRVDLQSGQFFSMATRSPVSSCVTLMASHSSCAWRRWRTSKTIRSNNNRQVTLISHQKGTPSKAHLRKKSFSRNAQAVSTSFSFDTTNRTYLYYTHARRYARISQHLYVLYINNACIIFCCSNKQYSITSGFIFTSFTTPVGTPVSAVLSITPVSISVSVSTAVNGKFLLAHTVHDLNHDSHLVSCI